MTSQQDASITYTIAIKDNASDTLDNLDQKLTNVERTTRKTTLATAAQRREFLRGGQSMFFAAGSAARLGEKLGVLNKKQAETIGTISDIGITVFTAALAFDKFSKSIGKYLPLLARLAVGAAVPALLGYLGYRAITDENMEGKGAPGQQFRRGTGFVTPLTAAGTNPAMVGGGGRPGGQSGGNWGGTTVNINAGVITGNPADAAKFGRTVTQESTRSKRNRGME